MSKDRDARLGTHIVVVGTSGSGKTTVAAALARARGLPHIELDALHFEADWVEVQVGAFRARVRAALDAAGAGWVVDGNYLSKIEDVVWSAADTIVWLDLPLRTVLGRLSRRTARRMATGEELWGTGNRERVRSLVTRDNMILWALRTHRPNRVRIETRALDPTYANLTFVRLRTPSDVARLLETR